MLRHAGHLVHTPQRAGTCVLSALGSVSSVDSTLFQFEACYWFNPQVLGALKLKHGHRDRKYDSVESEKSHIPPPPFPHTKKGR